MAQITAVNPWSVGQAYGVSEAIEVVDFNRMLMIGGQVSTDETGLPLHADDMAGQLTLVLDKIERVLAAAGYEPRHLVQLNYYVPVPDEYFANMQIVLDRTRAWGVQPTGIFCVPLQLGEPEWMIELTGMAVR